MNKYSSSRWSECYVRISSNVKPKLPEFISGLLIAALVFSSMFLNITFPFDGFLNRLRPVDLVIFTMIIFSVSAWNSERLKVTFAKLTAFVLPTVLLVALAVFDSVFRFQWQMGIINIWTIFYLFVPILMVGIYPSALVRRIILLALISSQFILVCWVLRLVFIEGIQDRILLSASFPDPNHTASWLLVCSLVLALGFSSDLLISRIVIIIMSLIAIGFLDSNSTFLASAICIPTVAYYLSRRRNFSKLVSVAIILASLAITVVIVFIPKMEWFSPDTMLIENIPHTVPTAELIKERQALPVLAQDWSFRPQQSFDSRLELLINGMEIYADNPIFGTGLDAALANDRFIAPGAEFHNEYVTFIVGYGPLGLITFIWFLIACYRSSKDAGRTVVLSIALIALTHASFSWRHLWIFLSLGIILDSCKSPKSSQSTRHGNSQTPSVDLT